ncbi:MAG TPA: VWA domain-containing protein, partial [Pyrinomonadaceae bacterium]
MLRNFAINIPVIAITLAVTTAIFTNAQSPQSQRGRTVTAAPAPSPTPSRSSAEPEAEVVRVETNLVNTLFTATDRDRHFITSLRSEDITIFEDDVAQPVSLFERSTDRPLSLAILVDTSESQRGVLDDEKRAAVTFVDSVIRPAKDQAAILSFTGVPQMEQPSTNDLAKLHRGIQRVRIEMSAENQRRLEAGDAPLPKALDPSGYTGIWDAMWMTIQSVLAQSPDATRRAIVLLSDGDDTSSTIKRQDVIDLAVKSDVTIYAIGLHDRNFSVG